MGTFRKLSDGDYQHIRWLHEQGVTMVAIAKKVGTSRSSVCDVVNGIRPKREQAPAVKITKVEKLVTPWRCPGCRQRVNTPTCRLCEVRAMA